MQENPRILHILRSNLKTLLRRVSTQMTEINSSEVFSSASSLNKEKRYIFLMHFFDVNDLVEKLSRPI